MIHYIHISAHLQYVHYIKLMFCITDRNVFLFTEKQFRFKKKIHPHPCPKVQIPFETDNSPDSFPPLTPQKVIPSQSLTSPPTPSYVQVVQGKHHEWNTPGTPFKDPHGGTETIHVTSPLTVRLFYSVITGSNLCLVFPSKAICSCSYR